MSFQNISLLDISDGTYNTITSQARGVSPPIVGPHVSNQLESLLKWHIAFKNLQLKVLHLRRGRGRPVQLDKKIKKSSMGQKDMDNGTE